jgi:hypothetical protein
MTTNPALAELEFLVGDWDMELSDTSFLSDRTQRCRGRSPSSGLNRARP